MATHIRAQCCWQFDSLLPRDQACITPCFRHQLGIIEGAPDWQTLCDDLANGLKTWTAAISKQLTVKLYDIGSDDVPNRPRATKIIDAGLSSTPGFPPEIALCLSYYGGNNAPNNRGRLYLPAFTFTGSLSASRPLTAQKQKVADLVTLFAGLGGVNVDWIVWSRNRNEATRITNWYVDDEWDIQRRRGLKPITRLAGTTSG